MGFVKIGSFSTREVREMNRTQENEEMREGPPPPLSLSPHLSQIKCRALVSILSDKSAPFSLVSLLSKSKTRKGQKKGGEILSCLQIRRYDIYLMAFSIACGFLGQRGKRDVVYIFIFKNFV